jgi:VanZ family protein
LLALGGLGLKQLLENSVLLGHFFLEKKLQLQVAALASHRGGAIQSGRLVERMNKENMMNQQSGQQHWPGLRLRWLIWLVFVLAWSIALVVPLKGGSDWVVNDINVKFLFAKSVHIGAYAVLAMLSGWLFVPARFRWMLVFFMAAHATSTELLQQLVPGRTGTLNDVGLDLIGIGVGFLLSWKWWSEPS